MSKLSWRRGWSGHGWAHTAAVATLIVLGPAIADSGHHVVRAVPTRRGGETLLTWTRAYLIRRHSQP